MKSCLTQSELARANRLLKTKHQQYKIITQAFTRLVLASYLPDCKPIEVEYNKGEFGKPELANDNSIQFNLTHSGDRAMLIVARDMQVGIDIELVKGSRELMPLAERYFEETELLSMANYSEEEVPSIFYNIWSRKEAFIKAIGRGLLHDLKSFCVDSRNSLTSSIEEFEPMLLLSNNPDYDCVDWELLNINVYSNKQFQAHLASQGRVLPKEDDSEEDETYSSAMVLEMTDYPDELEFEIFFMV